MHPLRDSERCSGDTPKQEALDSMSYEVGSGSLVLIGIDLNWAVILYSDLTLIFLDMSNIGHGSDDLSMRP